VKPVKMLGLAALLTLTALAFLGVNSAIAEDTVLCTVDEPKCAAPVAHVHEATLSGAKAKILTSPLTVECDVLFLGDTGELGAPLIIEGTFTYSNCTSGCTVTQENNPREIRVLKLGHETADLTYEYLVKLVCTGINCAYDGLFLKGTGKGPLLSSEPNGESSIKDQTLHKDTGLLCPATNKLDIVTTPLSATYIST
jgi:hypothetical protein